jgi:tellurite resistance protein TehA-like permease
MLRRLGVAVSYFIASGYILSILLPFLYCFQHHWCRGPAELDAFMPAFMLTPVGAIATAFSLRNAIQHIRKRESWSWVFWPLAIIFAIVLLGVIALIALGIYYTASHR